jgi:hypothetical protein
MAIEPSAFGAKICFHADQPPSVFAGLYHWEDVESLPIVVKTDGKVIVVYTEPELIQ